MSNSWNCPGWIDVPGTAVQVILLTASVTSAPCTFNGVVSARFSISAVQPATGLTDADAIGAFSGTVTSSLTVPAVAFSLGTRKLSFAKPPWVAVLGFTVTWADAGAAKPRTAVAATATTTPARTTPERTIRVRRIPSPVRVETAVSRPVPADSSRR